MNQEGFVILKRFKRYFCGLTAVPAQGANHEKAEAFIILILLGYEKLETAGVIQISQDRNAGGEVSFCGQMLLNIRQQAQVFLPASSEIAVLALRESGSSA